MLEDWPELNAQDILKNQFKWICIWKSAVNYYNLVPEMSIIEYIKEAKLYNSNLTRLLQMLNLVLEIFPKGK